jgi:hypothetical protein
MDTRFPNSPTRRLGHWAKLNRRQIANALIDHFEKLQRLRIVVE